MDPPYDVTPYNATLSGERFRSDAVCGLGVMDARRCVWCPTVSES